MEEAHFYLLPLIIASTRQGCLVVPVPVFSGLEPPSPHTHTIIELIRGLSLASISCSLLLSPCPAHTACNIFKALGAGQGEAEDGISD